MFFLMGISDKIAALAPSSPVTCPHCGQTTSFQITWIYHYLHLFFIPVFLFDHRYVATCSGCAAPFALEVPVGHAVRKGRQMLTAKHLIPLKHT